MNEYILRISFLTRPIFEIFFEAENDEAAKTKANLLRDSILKGDSSKHTIRLMKIFQVT